MEVRRASHTHQVPQVGLPQTAPENKARKRNWHRWGAAHLSTMSPLSFPDQPDDRRHRHQQIAGLCKCRGRNMQVDDAKTITLLVILRGKGQSPDQSDGNTRSRLSHPNQKLQRWLRSCKTNEDCPIDETSV